MSESMSIDLNHNMDHIDSQYEVNYINDYDMDIKNIKYKDN